jgi:hypothetical protein
MAEFYPYPPKLCLNGTSFSELRRQKQELANKLMDCLNALQAAAPHARDWQIDKGTIDYMAAKTEHKLRIQTLEGMLTAINVELELLEEQKLRRGKIPE